MYIVFFFSYLQPWWFQNPITPNSSNCSSQAVTPVWNPTSEITPSLWHTPASGVKRDLHKEHTLCHAEGGRIDTGLWWADLGTGWVVVVEVIRLDRKNDFSHQLKITNTFEYHVPFHWDLSGRSWPMSFCSSPTSYFVNLVIKEAG